MTNRPNVVRALTKAQMLQGRNYTETVYIPALDGDVVIRVLTGGEIARIKAIPARGLKISLQDLANVTEEGDEAAAGIDFDMEQIFLSNEDVRFMTVALGLSVEGGDRWSVADAEAISPPEAVEEIAKEIWRISKVDERDLTALGRFRPQPGGAGDRDAAPDGVPPGDDAG